MDKSIFGIKAMSAYSEGQIPLTSTLVIITSSVFLSCNFAPLNLLYVSFKFNVNNCAIFY
jgi:hypothetical protein